MLAVISPLSVPAGGYVGASGLESTFALLDRLLREFKYALRLRQRGSLTGA